MVSSVRASSFVVHRFDEYVGEIQGRAARQRRAIGGPERRDREERGTWELARVSRRGPRIIGPGAEVDQRGIDESRVKGVREVRGRAHDDQPRSAPRERRARECAHPF